MKSVVGDVLQNVRPVRSATFHRPCWVTNHGSVCRNVFCHDSSHANYGALANREGAVGRTLLNYSACAQISVIVYMNVAVARYSRSESHEVANYAVMSDPRIRVGMKISSYTNIRCDGGERANYCATPNIIGAKHCCIGCCNSEGPKVLALTALRNSLARLRVCNADIKINLSAILG